MFSDWHAWRSLALTDTIPRCDVAAEVRHESGATCARMNVTSREIVKLCFRVDGAAILEHFLLLLFLVLTLLSTTVSGARHLRCISYKHIRLVNYTTNDLRVNLRISLSVSALLCEL